jgi:hypothetical protein
MAIDAVLVIDDRVACRLRSGGYGPGQRGFATSHPAIV